MGKSLSNNITGTLKKNSMLFALIIVMVIFHLIIVSLDKGSLFSPGNISNLISQNAYVVVLATGMLLCILTGGNIDLSVGSIVALVGAFAGVFIVNMHVPLALAILLCLLAGTAIGAWHGFWIAYIRIPPFIVTLAGMLMWRGLSNVVLNGVTISPFPPEFKRFFTGFLPAGAAISPQTVALITNIVGVLIVIAFLVVQFSSRSKKIKKEYEVEALGLFLAKNILIAAVLLFIFFKLSQKSGIPVVLILIGIVVAAYSYFTSKTVPGRYLYALGGNEKAAKMSGVDTNKMLFFAYTNMGFLSAVAALMCVARFDSATPSAGTNYELDAIASCFIGGASAYGGTGTVSGAVIGAVLMGVLNQSMSILGVDQNWQRAVKGFVLLLAVVFDVLSKKNKKAA
ncbi:MAG: sugar ABC transporter permease [Termitinemataceae bacterium]|nr:MAG: sugar ABC transporter permease [Termitinemataceae bacterium]